MMLCIFFGEYRPENMEEPVKWHIAKQPARETRLLWSLAKQQFGSMSNRILRLHPVIAYKDTECNIGNHVDI